MAEVVEFSSLDSATQDLIRAAVTAREQAYCPYSNFKVGSSLLCTDQSMFLGCNVENKSYSMTICAERNAIFAAVAAGKQAFSTIVCVGDLADGSFLPPCGACRQVISEFGSNIVVYLARTTLTTVLRTTIGYLLPLDVNKYK